MTATTRKEIERLVDAFGRQRYADASVCRDESHAEKATLLAAVDELIAERDALAKDAARYAYLKDEYGEANFTCSGMAYLVYEHGSIDAAIDADIAARGSQ